MTASQFRDALSDLGIGQTEVARLFNANDRTVRRWVSGDRPVPQSVTMLIGMLLDGVITIKDIETARVR